MNLEDFYSKHFFNKNLKKDFVVSDFIVSIIYYSKQDSFIFTTKLLSSKVFQFLKFSDQILVSNGISISKKEGFLKYINGSIYFSQKISLFSSVSLFTFLGIFIRSAKNWKTVLVKYS